MNWVAAGVLGVLLTWLLQTSGPTRRIWAAHPLLTELGECDLCLGFWVYLALIWALDVNVTSPAHVPVLSEIATAGAFAFVAHLARLGWTVRFGTIELTSED